MNQLPKLTGQHSPPKPADQSIHCSPVLTEVAKMETSQVFRRMKTWPEGLSETEAGIRLEEVGPNVVVSATLTTHLVMCIAIWLPTPPAAAALGFTALSWLYWPIFGITVLSYVILTQLMKTWLLRKMWI